MGEADERRDRSAWFPVTALIFSDPKLARLVVAAVLFLGWLGYLVFLAVTSSRPIVLSRPQFLVSSLDVIAQVEQQGGRPNPLVTVKEVHWPVGRDDLVDQEITITNLEGFSASEGWQGPGLYILPLLADGNEYRLAPTPPPVGYNVPSKLHIYPATPQTRKQLERMPKPADLLK